ncbi:hypothetical protein BDW59DRAFT_45089 [Aspergillus cavernicola]|uniref:Uncharacterized protein n=1 Tax=Aspergillus cavernicola TaxID=176166 RepID=A0ABR4J3V2_9EURO
MLLGTGNLRFSGDMVLLSRIRFAQGHLDESLRLGLKALDFRKEYLGNVLKSVILFTRFLDFILSVGILDWQFNTSKSASGCRIAYRELKESVI